VSPWRRRSSSGEGGASWEGNASAVEEEEEGKG